MKRVCFAFGVLVVICLAPQAASADTLVDPIIGVRGCARAVCGSDNIDSGLVNTFNAGACPDDSLFEGFQCVAYRITAPFDESGITSLTVRIASVPPSALEFFEPGPYDPPTSFSFSENEDGTLTFTNDGAQLTCPDFEGDGSHACNSFDDVLLYLKPVGDIEPNLVFTSQVTRVNQTNVNPVPEPGSLLLMGTGLATLAAKARRKVQKLQKVR